MRHTAHLHRGQHGFHPPAGPKQISRARNELARESSGHTAAGGGWPRAVSCAPQHRRLCFGLAGERRVEQFGGAPFPLCFRAGAIKIGRRLF